VMSFTKETTIWCDKCDSWETIPVRNIKTVIRICKKKGWSFKKQESFCPKCTKGSVS